MEGKMIVVLSGGRNVCKSFVQGLFLAGDIARIQEHIEYLRLEEEMQKVRGIAISTAISNVAEQFRGLAERFFNNEGLREAVERAAQLGNLMLEELKEIVYINKKPLPRPPKIIPAFNVYESYKSKLNYKPVYYHIRSNC